MPLARSNSFRRSVAKRNKQPDAAAAAVATAATPAGGGGGVRRTGTVLRHNGKKWVARFGVLHADAVCLFASPKDWTPFRSFPEEVHLLDAAVTTKVGPSEDGELCLTIDSPTFDEPLMLSMESGEEAEAWQLALQEAVGARTGAAREWTGARVEHAQRLDEARGAAAAAESELKAAQVKAAVAVGEPSSAGAGAKARLDELRAQTDELAARAAETREAVATARAEAARLTDEAARARDELQHVRQVQMENIVDEVGPEADGPGFFESVIRPRVEAAAR